MTKKYYWLKLKDDFFTQKAIKKLRKIAGGDTFTIIYLKMMLLAMKSDGKIYFEGIENNFHEELALELDEEEENVQLTITYLINHKLMEEYQNEYYLPESIQNTGTESESAERVKKYRENISRIKEEVKGLGKIPYIESYQDNKLYDGNYYYALKRDNLKCVSCGADENLNMHHIIGNRQELKESRNKSSLITLCRKCHSREHAKPHSIITDEILKKIEFDFTLYGLIDEISNNTGLKKLESSVTSNVNVTTSNGDVTASNTEIDIELEKDLDKEKDIDIEKKNHVQMYDKCTQNVEHLYTQNRLDKVSKDKSSKDKYSEESKEILSYLNLKSDSNYRLIDSNLKLIDAILKKGYTKEDCFKVVDKKVAEWHGTDMAQYLRPLTIFSNKFDAYLNAPMAKKKTEFEQTQDALTNLYHKYKGEKNDEGRANKNIFDI